MTVIFSQTVLTIRIKFHILVLLSLLVTFYPLYFLSIYYHYCVTPSFTLQLQLLSSTFHFTSFIYYGCNYHFSTSLLFNSPFSQFSLKISLKISGGLGYTVIDVGLSVSSAGIVLLILVEFFRVRCAYVLKSSPLRSMRYVH